MAPSSFSPITRIPFRASIASALSALAIIVLLALTALDVSAAAPAPVSPLISLPPGFTEDPPITGVTRPIAFAWTPDGRFFVAEQGGALRVVKNGVLLPTPAITLAVSVMDESGLLGIAFDPQFATQPYVYLYYTSGPGSLSYSGTPVNRVSRFTVTGDTLDPGSELILVDNIPAGKGEHVAGDLHFGSDGTLYVSTGDSNDLSTPQNLDSLAGKILRIDPATGLGASGNPFNVSGASQNRQRVWAYGLRNPFRFSISPTTGVMYIADVGNNSYEELDLGQAGANYGWPQVEGPSPPGVPGVTYPIYWYAHSGNPDPNLSGCEVIIGGPFVPTTNTTFPASYGDNYFFADYACGRIFRVQPGSTPVVTRFAAGVGEPVNLAFGPDGLLYFSDYSDNEVRRVRGSGSAATATATATPLGSPSATPTPSASVTATATPTITSTATAAATSTATPTAIPSATASATPTTTPTATASATVTPSGCSVFTLYGDTLATGWKSSSWGSTVNLASTAYVYSGSDAVSFSITSAYGAFSPLVSTGTFDTSPYTDVRFYINGETTGGQQLGLMVRDASTQKWGKLVRINGYITGGSVVANQWQLVDIPLTALGVSSTQIDRIALQDVLGRAQPSVSVDQIEFGCAGAAPTPTPAGQAAATQ